MKCLRKITAFILAFILAVYGLPAIPSAQGLVAMEELGGYRETSAAQKNAQKETQSANTNMRNSAAAYDLPRNSGEVPQTKMRFIQKSFDGSTGILTMSLQISPELDGTNNWNIAEGVFVFQTDLATVTPVTNPQDGSQRQEIIGMAGRSAIVSSSENPEMLAYEENTRADWIEGRFNELMNPPITFETNHTAFMTARGPDGKLNCYFQFRYIDNTATELDEEGYFTVMDFDFQCYAGNDGSPKPATNTDCLFAGSLYLPQSTAEAEAICDSFSYTKEDGAKVPMTMGGAAFIQRYRDRSYTFHDAVYYYYSQPGLSEWRNLRLYNDEWVALNRSTWWIEGAPVQAAADAGPGLWYENIDKLYVTTGFNAGCGNTFSEAGASGEAGDFILPDNEIDSEDPRYVIPTEEEQKDGSWIPDAYLGREGISVPMKYFLSVDVSGNSVSSPTHEGIDAVLENIKWEFWLDGVIPLSECETSQEEAAGEIISTLEGDRLVKEAVLSDSGISESYQGTKVWKVYDAVTGEYLTTSPIGVLMVKDPATEITYMDSFSDTGDTEFSVRGSAPQFYVTSKAADPDSYIWNRSVSTHALSTQFDIRASYDPEGANYQGNVITVRLYKEEDVPTRVDLRTDHLDTFEKEAGGETIQGVYTGTTVLNDPSVETANDCFTSGVSIYSTLYNQYGVALPGKWTEVTFVPEASVDSAENPGPFQVVQVSSPIAGGGTELTDTYTIRYMDGKNVNDVEKGVYVLRAVYNDAKLGRVDQADVRIYVDKPNNRLNFVSTRFSVDSGTADVQYDRETADGLGRVVAVNCSVPPRPDGVTIASVTGNIEVMELANQWRTQFNFGPAYDVVPNLRTADGNIFDLNKVYNNPQMSLRFEVLGELPAGVALSEGFARNGQFTYNSKAQTTPDSTADLVQAPETTEPGEFVCKMTADYNGESRYVVYHFRFRRDDPFLNKIVIRSIPAVEVPKETEDPVERNLTVNVEAVNQYGDWWNWVGVESAYGPGGSLNIGDDPEPWSLYSDEALPAGVSLGGEHNAVLTVDYTAKACVVKVRAKYANKISEPAEIVIRRLPSEPSAITGPHYNGGGTVYSPAKDENDRVVEPAIQVLDQYATEMDPEDYTGIWSYTVTPASAGAYIQMDRNTGALTVKKFAPDCRVSVSASIKANNVTKWVSTTVTVARRDSEVTELLLETAGEKTDELRYPSREDSAGSAVNTLRAYGITQYSVNDDDKQLLTSGLEWSLMEVEFQDGKIYRYDETGDGEPADGEITYNSGSGRYTARSSVQCTTQGSLTFLNVTSQALLPSYITVSARYENGTTAALKIKVARKASYPYSLYFPLETYRDGIQVPTAGSPKNTLTLTARVMDQYGIFMDGKTVQWTAPDSLPRGVSVDVGQNLVAVDSTAQQGSFPMQASYFEAGMDAPLQEEQYVSIVQNEPLRITSVKVLGIRNRESSMEITLPAAKTGTGYDTHTLLAQVYDQFDNPMSSAVSWRIVEEETTSGIQAEFTDSNSGILRVEFTQAGLTALENGDGQITVEAVSQRDASVSGKGTISVKLQEAQAVYAVPTLLYTADEEGSSFITEDGVHKPVVPAKGDPNTEVKLEAIAKDQYGRNVNWPAKLNLSVLGLDSDVTLRQDSTAGENGATRNLATMSIGYRVTGYLRYVTASIEGQTVSPEEATLQIQLHKGPSYPCELVFPEGASQSFGVPYWVSDPGAVLPSEDTTEEVTLTAQVVDQSDAVMASAESWLYPIWEFVGDHEGVEFSDSMTKDAQGRATGGTLSLNVTNRAPSQVTLRVSTHGVDTADAGYNESKFVKLLTVNLTRRPSSAYYLYIDGINADGTAEEPIKRPYASEGSVDYQFKPVVYDRYGTAMEDAAVEMDLKTDELADEGFVIEEVYQSGQSADKGNKPISYKIYRVEHSGDTETDSGTRVLIAEFDCQSGKFTVYAACEQLDSVTLRASYPALGAVNGVKEIKLSIEEESARPVSVKISGNQGDYYIDTGSASSGEEGGETPDIADHIYAMVYDQYGRAYTGRVLVYWDLLLAETGEDGQYLPYDTELDEEGLPRANGDFLVQLGTKESDGSSWLIVKPGSFFENKKVMLQCQVIDQQTPSNQFYGYSEVNVQKKAKRHSHSGGIRVTFDAGEYGKLIGASEQYVEYGEVPENVPGVKTITGYGFMGWTTDGETVVDASKIEVFSDTVYSAVYRNISNTKFLEGYSDNTVRPNNHVTRAEFVFMVARALGGFDETKNYGASFPDVDRKKWYANAIAYGKQVGIVDGYQDGGFRPEDKITRAEAARILADAIGLDASSIEKEAQGPKTFSDVVPGAWYENYVEVLYRANVVDGYEDGTFRPRNRVTRAEAVKLILMTTVNAPNDLELENIREYAFCPFSDIRRTHWAYAYILRAAGIA